MSKPTPSSSSSLHQAQFPQHWNLSKDQLTIMVKSVPIGIIVVDRNMNYVAFSQRFLDENGLVEADLIGKNHYDVVPDLPEHWKQGHRKCLEEGTPDKKDDDYFIRSNGTIEFLRWEIQPWKDENDVIQGLIILLESLNERKKNEFATRESENRLTQVLSIIREGVWDWDIANNRIWNNQRWAEILRLDKTTTQHEFGFIQKIIHPDDLQEALDQVRTCLEGDGLFSSEYRVITPDNEIIWIKDRGAVTERDSSGKPTRMIGSIIDITRRKLDESKLKESSNLLAKLTNQLPGALFQFKMHSDGSMSFPYSSEGIREVLELTPEQAKQDASSGIPHMHPDDAKKVKLSIAHSGKTLNNWELEFRVLLPKKGLRWCRGIAKPEKLDDGSILWHGWISDITEKKYIELEKEQYHKFFDSSNDAMCIADSNNYLKKINRSFYTTLGYTEQEMLSKPFLDFLHEDDIKPTIAEMESKLSQGLPLKVENRFINKSGEHVWFSWRAFMNFEEGLIYATGRDITEKKKHELALIESEKNLQTIFELTPIPLVITKLYDNTVIMANEATETLLGHQNIQVIGKNSNTFFLDESGRKKIESELKQKGKAVQVEVVLKNSSNELITCLISCEVIYIRGEVALLSSILDITEIKRFEDELISKNNALQKTNSELDKFVYSTSHDLRAPLLSVLGLVDLSHTFINGDEQMENILGMMRKSLMRLDNTIKNILDYSRNSRTELKPEVVCVEEIVTHYIEDIRHMKEALRVKFNIQIRENAPFVTDKIRFTGIITNLITNAIKYQRENEPEPMISVDFICDTESATLKVSDNGEGMTDEKLQKLFGMFVRLSANSTGSGLGLYMTKEIVDKMGGTISVESTANVGSVFTVTLPNQPVTNPITD